MTVSFSAVLSEKAYSFLKVLGKATPNSGQQKRQTAEAVGRGEEAGEEQEEEQKEENQPQQRDQQQQLQQITTHVLNMCHTHQFYGTSSIIDRMRL